MGRGPYNLPLDHRFSGAGVYAFFYHGNAKIYANVRSDDATWPIYVGKAVPPGGRKGGGASGSNALQGRISQHVNSIQAASNLRVEDFVCRYLVVTPLWITMAERFLIEHYRPVWNVCIEGFGNHDPGAGRHAGEITWWDALHPGRDWAKRLRQTRTSRDAEVHLKKFLATYKKRPREKVLAHRAEDDLLSEVGAVEEDEE
jgi:hypothetical protein